MEVLQLFSQAVKDEGDYAHATVLAEEALALAEQRRDRRGIAWSLTCLAWIAYEAGNYPRAAMLFEQSLDQQQEVGDKHAVADHLSNLGRVMCYLGDYDRARMLLAERLTLFQELGNGSGVGYTLEGLAGWAVAQVWGDQAAHLLGAAEALREA